MIKQIFLNGRLICYNLEYKKVKNINIRIKADGVVYVLASKFVPESYIQKSLVEKAEFILRAVDKFAKDDISCKEQIWSEVELKNYILEFCAKIYPYYEKRQIAFPTIKFRKMTSMWGSCRPQKGVLTFNTNLVYAPKECVEYVVWHEFPHFLQSNHSDKFYYELSKVCPCWKDRKDKLKNIILR